MLWFLQLYPASRRPIIALSFIAMGTLLEDLQAFTSDRTPGYLDVAANIAGVMLGWLVGKTRLSKALEAVERTLIRLWSKIGAKQELDAAVGASTAL